MGGGGSSGQTQQSNQYTNLSPWAQPYVTSILGAAQQQVFNTDPTTGQITGINPYTAYGSINPNGGQYGMNASQQAAANASVAGFTPLQQQQQQSVQNLQNPWQTGVASDITGQATQNAANIGSNLAQQSQSAATGPGSVSSYMNPYLSASLAPQLQLLNQQYGIQGAGEQAAATSAGAFGGSREALMQGLNQQNQNLAANQLVSGAYNNAFNNAQNQMNTVANTNLASQQAALAGANQLGQLGTQGLANQQNILNMQGSVGGQQQQQQQNVINQGMQNYATAQQYPIQQLGQLKSLISGVPITDVTTTQQAAPPSAVGQLAGLGTTAAGIYGLANMGSNSPTITVNTTPTPGKAKGGQIKSYASEGIVGLGLYNAMKGAK